MARALLPATCLLFVTTAVPLWAQGVGWRGDGTGRFPSAEPPTEWDVDEGTNILWQATVGKGQSSPVIVGDRIFITAEPDVLLCLARDGGRLLWRRNHGYDALPPTLKPPTEKRVRAHQDCGSIVTGH